MPAGFLRHLVGKSEKMFIAVIPFNNNNNKLIIMQTVS